MGLLPFDKYGQLQWWPPGPVAPRTPDIPLVPDIQELAQRQAADAREQWHEAREAQFAQMVYDDLYVLDDAMALLADRSKSAATARKYALQWAKFRKFADEFVLADGFGMRVLPALPELVACFLLKELTRGQSYSSVKQAAGAISDAHVTNYLADPMQALVCRAAVRLARQHDGKFSKAKSNDKDSEPAKANGANGKGLEHER